MGRTARQRSQPHLPPVEKVELSSAHSGLKLTAAIVLLAVGVAALTYAITGLFSAGAGWQQIEAENASVTNCGDDFVLQYELGAGGKSPNGEKKALVTLYSDACVNAYRVFTADETAEDVHGLYYLNSHPNETVTLDSALYNALAQVQASGNRSIFLGPVYECYDDIFYCQDDVMTADFDPRQNEDVAAFFAQIAAYARDPAAVDIELLDGEQAVLHVSGEYLAFAEEEETGAFLDLGWMKNAFIADYLANTLASAGYTNGVISSYDGFARNLDSRAGTYRLDIHDLKGETARTAAALEYAGPMSIVTLRDYPASEQDLQRLYTFADGQVRSSYLDPADGLCRSAVHELTACSGTVPCGEMALDLAEVYVADSLDTAALTALESDGIYAVYCRDGRILCGGPLTLTDVDGSYELVSAAQARE